MNTRCVARRRALAQAGVPADKSLRKLPHNVNLPLHTVDPTAAYRTRHPETAMANKGSQQSQRDQDQGRGQQQQQQDQQRNQNQQQGWQDEEE